MVKVPEKKCNVGLSWFRFALKTGIIDGQRWLERAKNAPLPGLIFLRTLLKNVALIKA